MSMFASLSTSDPIPIPFDVPHTATIRKLTGREVDDAQAEHFKGLIAGKATHVWAAEFQQRLAKGIATNADAEQILKDPLNGYDRWAIVKAGLVAWTCDRPLSPEAIEDLEDDALDWFATTIMQRSKPRLFQTADDVEDARKNVSGPFSGA